MSVAVPAGFDYAKARAPGRAAGRGYHVRADRARALRQEGRARRPDQAVRLDGAGPAGGPSDAIVDLVSTGGTLRANNLVEVEEIVQISSRLVVNQAALKLAGTAHADSQKHLNGPRRRSPEALPHPGCP